MYIYTMTTIIRKSPRYFTYSVQCDSFVKAVTGLFRTRPELLRTQCDIYCRRPVSGDLQHMAVYDGLSVLCVMGERRKNVLTLSDGRSYVWDGTAFIRSMWDEA